jgi:CubicO group peptidase (beta-lactamase class C family)
MTPLLLVPFAASLAPVFQENPVHPALEGLEERWKGAMEELGVAGLAAGLVEGGELVHLAVLGERDTERHLPVTPDTMFYIASATKPYVAFVIVALAAEGTLELDAPVKRYLPRFELADAEAAEAITVRDLLCHRPGLNSFPIVLLDAYTGEITEDRYYRFLAEVEPLGQVAYSNVHFTLLGRVIEAVTGEPWRDALEERLFRPAGLTRTSGYASRMYGDADAALPTVLAGGRFAPAPVRKTDATMHAAGGLGTSVRDFARWAALNLGRGKLGESRLVPAGVFDDFFALQAEASGESGLGKVEGFALGWQRGTYRGHVVLQHGGGYVGSSSHVSFFPELDLGLAVLANADMPGQALCQLVAMDVFERLLAHDEIEDVLPELRRRSAGRQAAGAAVEAASASAPDLGLPVEACAGTYASELWGTLVLEERGGALAARLGDLALDVVVLEPGHFELRSRGALDAPGRFEVEGSRAAAVVLDVPGAAGGTREARFTR